MNRIWGAVAVVFAGLAGVPAAPGTAVAAAAPTDLPGDMPAAAYRPEPALPTPAGWGGSDAFPRTSGTGRYAAGAYLWTDYLYDDHGAIGTGGMFVANPAEVGSPAFGTYTYPAGAAHGNGADIFRAGVRVEGDATLWRVDWNTLADPTIPIAEWTFDTDDNAATGASAWSSGAGVNSPGIERALVVSSRGAWLVDPSWNRILAYLPVTVDTASRSFVVRVPSSALFVRDTWRIRLGAGLADGSGTGFAPPTNAAPGQAALYNVAFRTPDQETPFSNFWNDNTQATMLTTGDVSAFSTTIRWAALRRNLTTPEVTRTGWSDRWYASSIEVGQGRRTDAAAVADGSPTYLGRVQPYAVYVPTTYRPSNAAPLTFLLHSLTQNHNQYAATTPKFTQQACEARGSLCVTTLGRGPSGNYRDEAELDVWEVWREVAVAYHLDPESTIVAGYSMGGFGAQHLSTVHPDLFAESVQLAGTKGDEPAVENLRWVPVYLAGGAADELVPVTNQKAMADSLDAKGYRYRWLLYPAEDHVVLELQDGFSDAAAFMGQTRRTARPGHVTYRWTATKTDNAALSFGVTGAYWLRSLSARDGATEARLDAVSTARPDASVTPVRTTGIFVPGDPTPAITRQLTWTLGARSARRPAITAALTNVASVSILLADAGIRTGEAGTLTITTDAPTSITLVASAGTTTVTIPAGTTTIPITG